MWKNRGLSKKQKLFIVIGIILLFLVGAIVPRHFSITLSPSLDYRVFYLDRRVNLIEKGSYVLFKKSHYLIDNGKEFDVIKKIVCAEGDVFTTEGRDYYCNSKYLGMAKDKSWSGKKGGLQK